MGGKTLRLIGGSDCCLVRLDKPGLTRFAAAYESFSSGRSSLAVENEAAFNIFLSDPAKPVKALLGSVAATRRALPR